ncbi:MAG TPA: cupredoxin domain-containing protein [Pseudolabrys sp.]|nr:cupredoxin domain-containing protein [Pseudolabrys sp.]
MKIVYAITLVAALIAPAMAQQGASLSITVKNHQFQPATLQAPANVPITLRVKNLDPAPMEFESVSLRVEKVITGGGEGIVRLRPLSAGRYSFFDDFHQQTNGVLVVR